MRSRRHRGGRIAGGRGRVVIRLIPAFYRLHRIVHGDVHEREVEESRWARPSSVRRRHRNRVPVGHRISVRRCRPQQAENDSQHGVKRSSHEHGVPWNEPGERRTDSTSTAARMYLGFSWVFRAIMCGYMTRGLVLAFVFLSASAAFAQQDAANIGAKLMADAADQGRGRGDQGAAEPQTIEDQIRLCEVEAPPFKEAKRAEVYAKMFREARPAERAHRQGRQRARRSARRAAAPAPRVQRAPRHRVSRRHRRQGQARRQHPARPRHRRRLPRSRRAAGGRARDEPGEDPDAGHDHVRRHRRRRRPRRSARREVPVQRRHEGADRSLRLDRRHRPRHHAHRRRQPALSRHVQGTGRAQLRRVRPVEPDARARPRRRHDFAVRGARRIRRPRSTSAAWAAARR